MSNFIKIIMVILIANSCMSTGNLLTDKKINKQDTFESKDLKITTTVEKYSKSRKWFYGTIEMVNKTENNIYFNFNQDLNVNGNILNADYNFKPISYAHIAFRITPKSSSIWDVIWRMDNYTSDMEIQILNDLTVMEFKE